MDNLAVTSTAVDALSGSPEWERELCRREYNAAGQRVMEAQRKLGEAIQGLSDAAVALGRADASVEAADYTT